jgi:ribosomal protein L40E
VVILSLMNPDYLSYAVRCVPLAFLFSGMMFYQARRAKTPTVEEAVSQDQRPPMLYLRSFDQEAGRFVEVSHEAAKEYSEITSYQRTLMSYNLTLEQFLGREIGGTIGPFIALGNPTDYLQPEGAYRTYAADGNWQEYFTNLSDRSAGILMQVGNSDNLHWEMVSIKKRDLQTKLFVVTPPFTEADEDPYSLTRFVTWLTDRIKGIQPASWGKFAANLERAGYQPPPDPGPGAVVTFDWYLQPIKLISRAKTPAEYVGAIIGWLEKSPKQGAERQAKGKAKRDSRDTERDRVQKYGIQIVICSSCGTKNSLSFSNCIKCSKDLSKEKPVHNPYL